MPRYVTPDVVEQARKVDLLPTFRQLRQTNLSAAVRRNTAQGNMTVSKFRTANGIGGAVESAVCRRWIIS